jgi:hypothetical protein
MKNKGLSVHYHHAVLVEYCHDYNERVDYIKTYKPQHEQETRLRVFKLLSEEAIEALPNSLVKAIADRQKANADLQKAAADRLKANADWLKAEADRRIVEATWQMAYADLDMAETNWPKESRNAWHEKFCGCKEWHGRTLVFPVESK